MSWRKMPMRYPGTCIVCKEKIQVNEMGLWAKGLGVKHERCAEAAGLDCIICGGPAGCPECEFADECDIQNVSPFCICDRCSQQGSSPLASYQSASNKKFRILGTENAPSSN